MIFLERLSLKIIQFAILAGFLFLASCGGEDEPIITPPAPTVSITEGSGSSVYVGEGIILNVTGVGQANIVRARTYRDQDIISEVALSAPIQNFQFPPFSYTTTQEDAGQNIEFTFEVTDENGKSGEASYTLTVLAETPMAYDSVGAILGNRIGPDFSAWNLVDNVREARDAATSDMQNPSIADGPASQQWIQGWDGENETVFVKANDYDYSNATVESAAAKFAEGTSLSQVRDLVAGDIYIAKLRGLEVYVPILITFVSDNIEGVNTEEIIFSYKKETETAGQ